MNLILRRGSRSIVGLALAAILFASIACAASLAFNGGSLGAGSATVARCTAAALSVLQVLTTSLVTSVVVSGFPSSCGGATVQATVNNGATNSAGTATIPAGGGSVTVTLGVAVAVAGTDAIELVVLGP